MEYRIEASAALSAPANRGNRSHVQLSSSSRLDVSTLHRSSGCNVLIAFVLRAFTYLHY